MREFGEITDIGLGDMHQDGFPGRVGDAFPEIPGDQVSGCARTTAEGRLLPCDEDGE